MKFYNIEEFSRPYIFFFHLLIVLFITSTEKINGKIIYVGLTHSLSPAYSLITPHMHARAGVMWSGLVSIYVCGRIEYEELYIKIIIFGL